MTKVNEGPMDYSECESGWLIVENDLSTRLTRPEQLRYGRHLISVELVSVIYKFNVHLPASMLATCICYLSSV